MKKITVSDAINSLRPNSQFIIVNDDISGIRWLEKPVSKGGQSMPTEEEVEAEVKRLQEEYEYNQYQRDRKNEYPSIEDQLDLLYHQGYEGWKQEIDRVKEMHPKPNS
jgi:hypothetical protein